MKQLIAILVVLLVIAGGYFAFGRGSENAPSMTGGTPATPAPVKANSLIIAEAQTIPARHAALSMSTAGAIIEVLVKEGQSVTANQVLVRLANEQQTAEVAQAQAGLQRTQQQLALLKAGPRAEEVKIAEATVSGAQARLDQVTKVRGDTKSAQAELDLARAQQALLQAGPAQETIKGAEADVAAAQAALERAQQALAQTELRAPFAGTVVGLSAQQGEYTFSGTPLLQLADLSNWQIATTDLTELNVVRINPLDVVSVTFDAIPNLTVNGKVSEIKSLGENKQGDMTYPVIITLDRSVEQLRWNMTAKVTFAAK